MPTLLQINVTANWGSTGRIAEHIGIVAQKHGWDSYIAYGRNMNPSENKLVKIGRMIDVYEHYIENKLFDNEGLASYGATKKFLDEVDKIKPDIVHLHNVHDHYINYKLLLSYLAKNKIPVIWTQHDQWAITGHCSLNLIGCERWKELCYDCPLTQWYSLDRSKRNYLLKKKLLSELYSLTIITVSEWLADNIRKSYLKNSPIEVIHNGIDLNVFKPQQIDIHKRYGIADRKKLILVEISESDEQLALKDFCKLAEVLPSDEYVIVIVGKFSVEINEVISCNNDKCQMVFVDKNSLNALGQAQLYSAASVFINTVCHKNCLSDNIESIACGTPVIIYQSDRQYKSVNKEIIIVVEHGRIHKLAESVIRLTMKNRKEFILVCKKFADEYIRTNKLTNSYIYLYNKILSGNKIIVIGVSNIWHNNKGLSDFIALSKNPDFIVVLVGLQKRQADKLLGPGYEDCNIVPVLRTQNQQELAMLYSIADVLLSLSYSETFGLTMVEANACGTPCIVYDNTAQSEIVSPNTGRIARTGDIENVSKLIYEMKENNFKAKHTADCRMHAERLYDNKKCYRKYIDLYDKILNSKR